MHRIPRWLAFTAGVLLLVVGALSSFAVGTVRQPFPLVEGRVTLPDLDGSVEVLRDSYGVPHIYADSPEDLFTAQGYVHAQDRFYEMDYRRHLASGRLSELFGISQLETDAYVRTLGWRRVAEQELPLLTPATRRYLDAYAAGVNAYLQDRSVRDIAVEYGVLALRGGLGYRPEPWTPVDSMAWLKVMAWEMAANLDEEMERAVVTSTLGSVRAAALFPDYPANALQPIVDRGTVAGKFFDPAATKTSALPLFGGEEPAGLAQAGAALADASRVTDAIPPVLGARGDGGSGSNSWVISGSRSATGKAMLSNDPHLASSIPSTFAQVGLHCRTQSPDCAVEVSGFSMAAIPGVVIGRNGSIAWGLTTSRVDVQDLYLEDVQGDTVREGEAFVPLQVSTEEVRIRGADQPRVIKIRSSRHGPLLSDVNGQVKQLGEESADPNGLAYSVALSWVGLSAGRSMDGLLAINQAKNFDEFRAAAALLAAPSLNLVYADTSGDIGYQLSGAVPLRGEGQGVLPSPGWDRAYDWTGVIDFVELPYAFNPPGGVLVAANQPVIGRQYPYRLGTSFSYGWRSQEILDTLRQSPPLTLDDAERLFYDDTLRFAADLVPRLLRIKVSDPWVVEGQASLVGWDYSTPVDSAPAAYFNVVFHDILKLTFRDELPEHLWPSGGDRWYAVVRALLEQPRNLWWDDITTPGKVETRDDILLSAMTDARKEITSLMARDTDEWRWGRLHTLMLRNTTLGRSGVAPIRRLLNRGPYEVGGGPGVVNATAFDDREGYAVTTAPAMRMLVDLGDLDNSRWVNQTGVSGHAYHRNYDDQTALWLSGRTWPFLSSREAIDARTTARLELAPGG